MRPPIAWTKIRCAPPLKVHFPWRPVNRRIHGFCPCPASRNIAKWLALFQQLPRSLPNLRALAVRRACDLAIKNGQVAAGIFSTGQSQTAIGNSRGLFAAYRETHAEFSITMQEKPAASWAKANSADVRNFDPQKLAARASEKAQSGGTAAGITGWALHRHSRAGGGSRSGRLPLL